MAGLFLFSDILAPIFFYKYSCFSLCLQYGGRITVHYVVTEYGIADLYGKTLIQRAKALIDVAHPDFREELDRFVTERYFKKVLV